jgi:hypothetical protein
VGINLAFLAIDDINYCYCGSSVSIVTRLRVGRTGFHSRQGKRFFLFIRQTLGVHLVSYPKGTRVPSPGVNWPVVKLTIHLLSR